MVDIKIEIPGKDVPGYIRRTRLAAQFQDGLKYGYVGVTELDAMIDFVLELVVEPADKEEARILLIDASENEFDTILMAIKAGRENPTSASTEKPSKSGSEAEGQAP